MDKLNFETPDMVSGNIEKIAALFPSVITEMRGEDGQVKKGVNFEVLKQLLSRDVVDGDECYEFTWVGKKAALAEAARPITKTLRPVKEDSRNWDTTENLYIEGDNLEVLKILQESYLGKVKMIYIDPPYNTGHDFIYRDRFQRAQKEENEQAGMLDEDGNQLFENTDSNGHFHSDWCSMIAPRLQLSRNLLSDDGITFISIDDNELKNLQQIASEIFGEENCELLVWEKVSDDSGKLKVTYRVRTEHEYVLVCYKNKENTFFNKYIENRNYKNEYTNPDNDFRGPYKQAIISDTEEKSNSNSNRYYSITSPSGAVFTRQWRVEKWEMDELIADNRIFFGNRGDSVPALKAFINEPKLSTPSSLLKDLGTAKTAGNLIEKTLGHRAIFSYPKPVEFEKRLIQICTDKRYSLNPAIKSPRKVFFPGADMRTGETTSSDIILDFFSGSATTAHAVMQLNAEDGGHRKFIMVQLPEPCDEKSEAFKAGYKNICEIGKERIRRAGDKIKTEHPDADLDIGFRVFRVDESNMKNVYYHPEELTQLTIGETVSNIKDDRTDLDLLYACLLDWGVEISLPHTAETVDGCTVHNVDNGALMACFNEHVPASVVEHMAKQQPLRAVFRDSAFATDADKINVTEIFKNLSPDTKVKVI